MIDTRTPAQIRQEVLEVMDDHDDQDGRPVTHTMAHLSYRLHLTMTEDFRRLQAAVRWLIKVGDLKVHGISRGRRTSYVHSANWARWQEAYKTTPAARRNNLIQRMRNLTDEQVAQVEKLLEGVVTP